MSAEERDLLAAECPIPGTLAKARKLADMFRRQGIYFPYDLDQRLPDMWNDDRMNEVFSLRWGVATIFQREKILVAWTTEILTGVSK